MEPGPNLILSTADPLFTLNKFIQRGPPPNVFTVRDPGMLQPSLKNFVGENLYINQFYSYDDGRVFKNEDRAKGESFFNKGSFYC